MALNVSIFTLLCKPALDVYLSLIVHQKPLARWCFFDPRSDGYPDVRVHPDPLPLRAENKLMKRLTLFCVKMSFRMQILLWGYQFIVVPWMNDCWELWRSVQGQLSELTLFGEEIFWSTKSKQSPYWKAHLSQHHQFAALPLPEQRNDYDEFQFSRTDYLFVVLTIIQYKAHRTTKRLRNTQNNSKVYLTIRDLY